jgi:hypothetical protein
LREFRYSPGDRAGFRICLKAVARLYVAGLIATVPGTAPWRSLARPNQADGDHGFG